MAPISGCDISDDKLPLEKGEIKSEWERVGPVCSNTAVVSTGQGRSDSSGMSVGAQGWYNTDLRSRFHKKMPPRMMITDVKEFLARHSCSNLR